MTRDELGRALEAAAFTVRHDTGPLEVPKAYARGARIPYEHVQAVLDAIRPLLDEPTNGEHGGNGGTTKDSTETA